MKLNFNSSRAYRTCILSYLYLWSIFIYIIYICVYYLIVAHALSWSASAVLNETALNLSENMLAMQWMYVDAIQLCVRAF